VSARAELGPRVALEATARLARLTRTRHSPYPASLVTPSRSCSGKANASHRGDQIAPSSTTGGQRAGGRCSPRRSVGVTPDRFRIRRWCSRGRRSGGTQHGDVGSRRVDRVGRRVIDTTASISGSAGWPLDEDGCPALLDLDEPNRVEDESTSRRATNGKPVGSASSACYMRRQLFPTRPNMGS
jgi:hypothetical protein